jgi:hypothetical protein
VSPGRDTQLTYSIIGSDGQYNILQINDRETDPDSGKSRIRVLNGSYDAGSLDVYVSRSGESSSFLSSNLSSVTYGKLTGFYEVDQGAFTIRATAAGDRNDVRFELTNVSLSERQNYTVLLTPSSGGALVHAVLLPQQKATSDYENKSARIRLAAAADGAQFIAVTVPGQPAIASGNSPSVGSYALVPKGQQTLNIALNGNLARSITANLDSGSDSTLLVMGEATDVKASLIMDKNRIPTATNKAKLRTVHGINGATNNRITTSADYSPINSGVAFSSASDYTELTSGNYTRIDVTEAGSTNPIYIRSDFDMPAGGVYTLFMLGNRTQPVGILRRDR